MGRNSKNYEDAVKAHRELSRIGSKKNPVSGDNPRYLKANAKAGRTYDRLTTRERLRFDFKDSRTS